MTENSLDKGRNEEGFVAETKQPEITSPQKVVEPFTIPTPETQVPVQVIPQTNISSSSVII